MSAAVEHITLLLSIVMATKENAAAVAKTHDVPGKSLLKQRLAMFTEQRKGLALQPQKCDVDHPFVDAADVESVAEADDMAEGESVAESLVDVADVDFDSGAEVESASGDMKPLSMLRRLVHLSDDWSTYIGPPILVHLYWSTYIGQPIVVHLYLSTYIG